MTIIIIQLLLKTGLKRWGDKIYDTAHSEIKQLHYRDTFRPKHRYVFIYEQKIIILELYIFLKKNIKNRTVTEDNKQYHCISKKYKFINDYYKIRTIYIYNKYRKNLILL